MHDQHSERIALDAPFGPVYERTPAGVVSDLNRQEVACLHLCVDLRMACSNPLQLSGWRFGIVDRGDIGPQRLDVRAVFRSSADSLRLPNYMRQRILVKRHAINYITIVLPEHKQEAFELVGIGERFVPFARPAAAHADRMYSVGLQPQQGNLGFARA